MYRRPLSPMSSTSPLGHGITVHTARNWLLGNALPTQDKLEVLAEWLQVGPDELRFGVRPRTTQGGSDAPWSAMSLPDREMLRNYLELVSEDRRAVRRVVAPLRVAYSAVGGGATS